MAKNLSFTVWLNDKTQKGFNSFKKNMQGMQKMTAQANKSWMSVGTGAAGLWGVSNTATGLVQPAREMERSRRELMSLLDTGAEATANVVQNRAMEFSETYGKSASQFVAASYDIQSAIDGLSANNLATFTNASAVLATATKADTATITSYMGTMYGIFKKNANAIGKNAWVEQIAGQTATAVQQYKTTGSAMNEAFAGLGARAANQGISSAEQFAVLGSLQSTMQGSVAGTAYAGFLDAIPTAERVLGVSFAGDDGRALGIIDIIDRLKTRLGDDLGVEQVGWLNKAFGTNAAGMIQNLWTQTDSLKSSIETLSNVGGMEKAITMANKMVDPYDQLGQVVNNVRIVFGQALSGSLQPFINYMISGGQTLRRWTTLFPNLTKYVGYFVIGIGLLTAGMAALAMITGITQLAWVGLKGIWIATKFVLVKGLWASVLGFSKLLLAMIPAVWSLSSAFLVGLGKSLLALLPTLWGVATAFIVAIGWVPLAIVGVIAAVGAMWAYWDDFVSWLTDAWSKVKEWFGFGDSSLDIETRREEINSRLPDVARTTDQNQAQVIPASYVNNSNSNSRSNNIGTINVYPKNVTDPNSMIKNLAMVAP